MYITYDVGNSVVCFYSSICHLTNNDRKRQPLAIPVDCAIKFNQSINHQSITQSTNQLLNYLLPLPCAPTYRCSLTFAAAATMEGVSSLKGDGTPLDGLKNAGKSSVP